MISIISSTTMSLNAREMKSKRMGVTLKDGLIFVMASHDLMCVGNNKSI